MTLHQRSHFLMFCVVILLGSFLSPRPGGAQTNLATIRGQVVDQQGATVPDALVTARETATNLTRTSTTQPNGQYLLSNLPAGQYELTVVRTGFRTSKQSELGIQVGQQVTLDFSLTISSNNESVVVNAQVDQLPTESAVGLNIGTQQVDSLPTSNRNFAGLAALAPGISSTGTSSMGFNASGQHQYQNNVFVDGAPNAMKFYGTQADVYPQDWIQEFQVMTNGFAPEFGNASGAFLNVITRSGTNNIHGRVYGFLQNAVFNSPPYAGRFANGSPVFLPSTPDYNQRRLGAYIGGPVIKDQLFFFGGYEDFVNNATTSLSISPYWIAQGYQAVIPSSDTIRPFILKADWNISDKHRLTYRFDRTYQTDVNCSGQGGDGCNSNPLWALEKRATFQGPLWSTIATFSSTMSNRSFNEFRVYYGVNLPAITSNIAGKYRQALLSDTANLGRYSEKTYPGIALGASTTGGIEGERMLNFTDNFTFIKGPHELKFGVQLYRDTFVMNIDASQKGRWAFTSDKVFNINDPSSYPATYTIAVGSAADEESHWNPSAYAQDTWRVNRKLTLNLGVRYDVDNTILAGNQFIDSYNQRIMTLFGGSAPLSKVKADLNNVAPRLGATWSPFASGNTTFRGNFGFYYDQNHYNYNDTYLNQTLLANRRYSFNVNNTTLNPFCTTNPTGCKAQLGAFLASKYPNPPDFSVIGVGQAVVNGMDPNFRIPYTIQWSGGATHQFGAHISAQADFVHSHGVGAIVQRNVNVTKNSAGTFVTIDPRFSSFSLYQNLGWIKYNALLTRVAYRTKAASFGISYTLGHTTSDTTTTGVGGGAVTNPLDLSVDAGPADEDRRHNLVVDGNYNLPLGFQLSGLFSYASALPYSISDSTLSFARPAPRGSLRGDDYIDLDMRAGKAFKFKERYTATFFAEVFNLANADNFTTYQGSIQSSAFKTPQAENPKRRAQFGFRFDF
jgi:hypothetical protein